ncbi:MAG: cytochrome c-type biogenesis protein CcmH [Acidobacteriota bacterium]
MIAFLLVLLLQVKVPDAAQFVGAPQGTPLSGVELDRSTTEVGGLLRCPVCQGLSIADSPSAMAVNMKEQVRDLLSRGYTREQILRYFEQSYGQFVLLRPKFQGVNSLVWLLPLAALLLGVFVVVSKNRALSTPEVKPLAEEDPYLARVREMVEKE